MAGHPKSYGKLGWDTVSKVKIYFDCAVLERHQPSGPGFRYGLVMLHESSSALKEVGLEIDDIMKAWHKPSYAPGTRTGAAR